jgi:hypothetical protein
MKCEISIAIQTVKNGGPVGISSTGAETSRALEA